MWYLVLDAMGRDVYHLYSNFGAYAGTISPRTHKPGDAHLVCRMMNGGPCKVKFYIER